MRSALRRTLDRFNVKVIILTHAHVDHVWNAAYLSRRYKAQIAIGKEDVINLNNYNINPKPSKRRYRLWTGLMNFGMKHFKQPKFTPDIELEGDKDYEFCGEKLRIVNLSGHTNGSIGVLYKGYLFAGDALVNRKSYVEIAYQNQNNECAKESMNKIKELHPKKIYVGHDRPIKYDKLVKSMKKNKLS